VLAWLCILPGIRAPKITGAVQPIRHHLHWSWWRRRHQARARWFHQLARLRRRAAGP